MGHNMLSSFVTPIMPSAHIIKKAHTDTFPRRDVLTSTPMGEEAQHTLGRLHVSIACQSEIAFWKMLF